MSCLEQGVVGGRKRSGGDLIDTDEGEESEEEDAEMSTNKKPSAGRKSDAGANIGKSPSGCWK